jgi:hypothetical protein
MKDIFACARENDVLGLTKVMETGVDVNTHTPNVLFLISMKPLSILPPLPKRMKLRLPLSHQAGMSMRRRAIFWRPHFTLQFKKAISQR